MTKPALTVIALAPYGIEELADTLFTLRHQTIADALEVILVVKEATQLPPESETAVFHSFQVLISHPMKISGVAKALAVERASSSVVAFAEDHCFPEAGWAQALVEAHREPWGAVAPCMSLANPGSAVARASFENSFGAWHQTRATECENLPTHNTSYKRDLLLEYGDDLPEHLDMEAATLAPDLRNRGFGIFLEIDAKVHHINVETWPAYLKEQFLGGRHYGALRCKHWPNWRRFLYAGAGWLIPAVRFMRMGGSGDRLTTLVSGTGLVVTALGEVWGYLFGLGRTDEVRFDMEYRRWRHTKVPYRAQAILARKD
jgi:hypothetical protein